MGFIVNSLNQSQSKSQRWFIVLLAAAFLSVSMPGQSSAQSPQEGACLKLGERGSQGGIPNDPHGGWILDHPCCKPLIDREPAGIPPYGGGYAYMCIACGDGVCDPKYENATNCPEDCKK